MMGLHVLAFAFGVVLVGVTGISAMRTLLLPRGTRDLVSGTAFQATWLVFGPLTRLARSYERRDRIMALYAPVTLILLIFTWLAMVLTGFMLMFWGAGVQPMGEAFVLSGSSLLTLGFATQDGFWLRLLIFLEAAIGLGLVALLIAYLPTMYTEFSRREESVNLLEVRAGSPPSAVEWLVRVQENDTIAGMAKTFEPWEHWFAELEESHTSLLPLVFFRSPQPDRSWITAAGAVLDTAALFLSAVDIPVNDMPARLCLRAGYLALGRIADLFDIPYHPNPSFPDVPISISREEFDEACAALEDAGVPLREDLNRAWLDFAGWRVNYDRPLLALAALVQAPYAPWSSDRSVTGIKVTEETGEATAVVADESEK